MKRPCEDSSSADSEVEEAIHVGRESLYAGHMKASFLRCGSPTTTTQVVARKKRRGVIEKRRRDRINNSLSELRRLVPTALHKQGSAKLEKAEILQMTVDHLKVLQATGGKGYFDAHALALDFLSLGFRECVMEVSRYLSAVEVLDSGNPLPSRLLSHLASCSSQRAAAALTVTPIGHFTTSTTSTTRYLTPSPPPLGVPTRCVVRTERVPDPEGGAPQRLVELSQRSVASSQVADSTSSPSSSPPPPPARLSCSPPLSPPPSFLSASFPFTLHGGFPILPPSSFTSTAATTSPPISSSSSSSSSSQTPHSSSKPYRPWGTEVGAF